MHPFYYLVVDPRTVTRSYAKTGHYSNVISTRPNYHLLVNTPARRLLVDGGSKNVTGVEFTAENSTLQTVSANKEVILAAGAVHTPQLLQLSGIGPRAILESAGIETIVDLPGVGQNFQDHSSIAESMNITRKYPSCLKRNVICSTEIVTHH
jgi:choline dehydrogenase